MRLSRVFACMSAVAITAGLLTAPAVALAADGAESDDRIILEPPAPEPEINTSETKAAVRAATKPSHPPISRAERMKELPGPNACKADSEQKWVVLPGPGDIQIAGWARCRADSWTLKVVTGTGHVGGMTLRPQDFVGSLTIDSRGSVSGGISVSLPWKWNLLPGSRASALLSITPQDRRLVGLLTVREAAGDHSLNMSGPISAGRTFSLRVRGGVRISNTVVPVQGTFQSASNAVRGRGSAATWLVRGVGRTIALEGVSLARPTVLISSARPGVSGTSTATLIQQGITAPVELDIRSDRRWTATFDGAREGVLRDARISGLSLLADEISGTISTTGSRQRWNVRIPMRLVDARLVLRGTATLVGPNRLKLAPQTGSGDLFGTGDSVVFTKAEGSAIIEGRRVRGRMSVSTPGERLIDMPSGWYAATALELTPTFSASGPAVLKRGIRYLMADGGSRIALSGDLPASGPLRLKASGRLTVGKTSMPVRGYYVGGGPRDPETPVKLDIRASTSSSPERQVDLGHGLFVRDSVFRIGLTGQPVSRSAMPRSKCTEEQGVSNCGGILVPTADITPSTGGSVSMDVADVNTTEGKQTVTLTGSWTYANGQYVVSVQAEDDFTWEPIPGMEIPAATIRGTIYVANDKKTVTRWSVTGGPVEWQIGDPMQGETEPVTLTTTLILDTGCPLAWQICPKYVDDTAFFMSGTSTITNIPYGVPDLIAEGAVLSDGTWTRWDAGVTSSVTIPGPADSGITLEDDTITIFTGATRADPLSGLEMPDLSDLMGKNKPTTIKLNVQWCGSFEVEILDLDTGKGPGCIGLTPGGIAIGQTKTGGDVKNIDQHNGLSIDQKKSPSVSGFAWSNIFGKKKDSSSSGSSSGGGTPLVVKLYGKAISMMPKMNYFTLDMTIPGPLMESLGTGQSTDTDMVATGWFAPKTWDFYADLDIPVNLSAGGVHLEDINISLKRMQEASGYDYDFKMDASGEAAIQGRHYPFDANIELKTGTTNFAQVSLAVIGEESVQTSGNFDDTSLLTEGDFEPATSSYMDGDFDSDVPASDFKDGSFEAGTASTNLIPNASFEDSASLNLLPKDQATFDGGISGNVMPNADFDDTNFVYNSGFEGVDGLTPTNTILGWALVGDDVSTWLSDDAGPSIEGNGGTKVACVQNTSSSTTSNYGLQQKVFAGVSKDSKFRISGYMKSGSGNSATAVVGMFGKVQRFETISGVSGSWTYFSYDQVAQDSGSVAQIVIGAGAKSTVCFDEITFTRVDGGSGNAVGAPIRPSIVETFDGGADSWDITRSGGVTQTTDGTNNGVLWTDGCKEYWGFKDSSRGYLNSNSAPWDMSVNVYFPDNDKREMATIGFLMSDVGDKAYGYGFRMQTAEGNNRDGGFWQLRGSTSNRKFGTNVGTFARQTWFNVRIAGWNETVTIKVTKLADGSTVYEETVTLPDFSTEAGRVFGQVPEGACSDLGSYWDDFTLRTSAADGSSVRYDPGTARSAPGYGVLKGSGGIAGYLTPIGQEVNKDEFYSYTAWVRAESGTASGLATIQTSGPGDRDLNSQFFTVGTQWQQVRVSLRSNRSAKDIAAGITGISSNVRLYVDDQNFQRLPWSPTYATGGEDPIVEVMPDPTGDDDNVMFIDPQSSVESIVYYNVGMPNKSSRYLLSANIRSVNGSSASGILRIYDANGSVVDKSFTAGDSWQTVTVDLTSGATSPNPLAVAIRFTQDNAGIYVDDVSLTASETTSSQTSGSLGALPAPAGWQKTGGSASDPLAVNSPGNARTGSGYLRVQSANGSAKSSVYYDIATAPTQGQDFVGSVWVKAPGGITSGAVSVTLRTLGSSGQELDKALVTPDLSSRQYVEVPVALQINKSGAVKLQLVVENTDTGQWIAVDDLSVSLDGLSLVDPWTVAGSVGLVAKDDSTVAFSGNSYLAINAVGSGSASVSSTVTPASTARTFTAWVRAVEGTVNGTVKLSRSGSSTTASTTFAATTTWSRVTVMLPSVVAGQSASFTSTISLTNGGKLLVDELATRDLAPFVPSGSGVSAVVITDTTNESAPPPPAVSSSSTSTVSAATDSTSRDGARVSPRSGTLPPPAPPTAVVSGTSVTLSWKPSSSTGVTGYKVKDKDNNTFCTTNSVTQTSCYKSGVAPGTYQFAVRANGMFDNSGYTTYSSPVTVVSSLPKPTNVTATISNGYVTVAWTPIESDEAVTKYQVADQTQYIWCEVSGNANSCRVNGLPDGTYTFAVRAVTDTTLSAWSGAAASVTVQATPSAPVSVTAVGSDSTATIRWESGYSGTSAISAFEVADQSDKVVCSVGGSTFTCSVADLPPGTYQFKVRAKNASGWGAWSGWASTQVLAAPTPGTVTAALAEGTNGAQVSWTASSSVGGAITRYQVADQDGRTRCTTSNGTTLSCSVSDLVAGTYQFKVRAENGSGWGLWSTLSNAITVTAPAAAPAGAASNPNHLMVTTTGAGSVIAPMTVPSDMAVMRGGSTYTVRAKVKTSTAMVISGSMGLVFGSSNTAGTPLSPQLEEGDSPDFTVGDTWTKVTATFTAPGSGSYSTFAPTFTLSGAGTLFIDDVTITPVQIVQEASWSPYETGSSKVSWGVYDDPDHAHDGSLGSLRMTSSASSEAGVVKSFDHASKVGQVYSASAWVRTASGTTADVRLEVSAIGGTTETQSQALSATDTWQLINFLVPIKNSGHTGFRARLVTTTPNVTVYLDDVSVVLNQWLVDNSSVSTRTNMVGNPSFESNTNGWNGIGKAAAVQSTSLFYFGNASAELQRGSGSSGDDYVEYPVSGELPSTQYTVSAYVWLPPEAAASSVYEGRNLMWVTDYGTGGVIKSQAPDFTKVGEWQRISVTTTTAASNVDLKVRFYVPTGGRWYIDGVQVEQGSTMTPFIVGSETSASSLAVVGDGPGAYEGLGYAQLTSVGTATPTMSATADGNYSGNQNLIAHVRSATGESLSGNLMLGGSCTASTPFTATAEWQQVRVNCTASGVLTMAVQLTTPGGVLDVDSIRLDDQPDNPIQYNNIFGVTSPLPHPEYGYHYLWDDAFGIPGMHLWGFTVQVKIYADGTPGLGVQATVYQDPTKLGAVLYGSSWLKSDLVVNIDERSPCMLFDFASVDGSSGVQLIDGAIKSSDFSISFAPRGCSVGDYRVPQGAAVLFDAEVGDATLHFQLAMGRGNYGPEFTGDVHVTNLDIGGIDYRNLEMSVVANPIDDTVMYTADMRLPMGNFTGDFNLEAQRGGSPGASKAGLHVDGDVELSDWGWKSSSGKGFKVNEFSFDMSMDVGANNCGTFKADAKGDASADFAMASSLKFEGHLQVECGILNELQFALDYTHGAITQDLFLDYDMNAGTISGGVSFQFQRKISWKYLSHRYHRTTRVQVYLDFLMDVTNPAGSEATLGADVKVANGEGTADCRITGQPSDSCDITVKIDSSWLGKQTFRMSW